MREILFRGKKKESGMWVYGDLDQNDAHNGASIREHGCIVHAVEPSSIGQFTGLLDKEGNKIFEGDVLRSVHFKEGNKTHYLYHIIKWDNRLSGWIAQNIDTHNGNFTGHGNPQIWVYIKNADFDIMGPIHDHPHLLNKTSNQ